MKKISVWNLKGGVGKTTATVNIAYNLSITGKKVLVIDLDPQTNTTPFFTKANENGRTIRTVLNSPVKIGTSIVKSKYKNIDIIKGSTLLKEDMCSSQNVLLEALLLVEKDYDYVIIDCRPTSELLTLNALAASDMVLTPIHLDGFCRDNLREVSTILDSIDNCEIKWNVFVNRIRNTQAQRKIFADLMEYQDFPIMETAISDRAAVANSIFHKKPLLKHASKNDATKDFLDLIEELGV